MAITEGSIVQLRSGGPYMTVNRVFSPSSGPSAGVQFAECQWFDKTTPHQKDFPLKSLDEIKDEGPIEPQF